MVSLSVPAQTLGKYHVGRGVQYLFVEHNHIPHGLHVEENTVVSTVLNRKSTSTAMYNFYTTLKLWLPMVQRLYRTHNLLTAM